MRKSIVFTCYLLFTPVLSSYSQEIFDLVKSNDTSKVKALVHPYISPDGDYFLFSNRSESGRYDIFIGYKKTDGSWTRPINPGTNINSAEDEFFPIVSGDGKYLFFSSGRNGFGGKCWVSSSFIENLRPKE